VNAAIGGCVAGHPEIPVRLVYPPPDHVWRLRRYLPERYGQPCRVLARGRGRGPRNVLVEFEDGFRVVGTRFCVRRVA
jgi:hypothetical protein